ncbi:MAG: hypothetical protein H6851_14575 [Geminicoccaceae bacterium]|nr:hypothetical protein [Geminicoccaceae bacterium]
MKKTYTHHPAEITESDLNAFVDGVLDFDRRRDVIDYLSDHPVATGRVDSYLSQMSGLRELGRMLDIDDSENFCPDLQRRLVAERRKKPVPVARYLAMAASVAVVVAAGFLAFELAPHHGGQADKTRAALASDARVLAKAMVVDNGTAVPAGAITPASTTGIATALPMEANESPVTWLTRHMVDHVLRKPNLDELGLRFVNGGVLANAATPTIQLIYEDEERNQLSIYAGLFPGTVDQTAFATVPEGHLSLHWRRGPLLFALVAPMDSPNLDKMVNLVSAGLAKVPQAPAATESAATAVSATTTTAAVDGNASPVNRLAEGGALMTPSFDMISGPTGNVAVPAPRPPEYHFSVGDTLRQPQHGTVTPALPVEPNKPEAL